MSLKFGDLGVYEVQVQGFSGVRVSLLELRVKELQFGS